MMEITTYTNHDSFGDQSTEFMLSDQFPVSQFQLSDSLKEEVSLKNQ